MTNVLTQPCVVCRLPFPQFTDQRPSYDTCRECQIVPALLWCPECGTRHIDEGSFAAKRHHTHACQSCGHVWRPAVMATCGVRFLPGFKNEEN